jgi:excisionase family DNA binding protein
VTTAADPQPLLRANEVARRLNVCVETVYRLSAAGRLPAIRLKPTGPLRFEPAAVEALIENGRRA